MTPNRDAAAPAWLDERVRRLRRMIAGDSAPPPPAASGELALLAARCDLSELDLDILTLALASELDLIDQQGAFPSVGEAGRWLGRDLEGRLRVRRRFDVDAPLRRVSLILLEDFDGTAMEGSLANCTYQAASRVVDLLLGRTEMDPSIRLYARLQEPSVTWETLQMPTDRIASLQALLGPAGQERGRPLLLLACGPANVGRLALSEATAAGIDRRVLVIHTRLLCTEGAQFQAYVRRILREAAIQGAMPVFVEATPFRPGEAFDWDGFSLLMAALDSFPGPSALCIDLPLPFDLFPSTKRVVRADVDPPLPPHRQALWTAAMPSEAGGEDLDLRHFAKLFNFGGGGIAEMVQEARNKAHTERGPDARIAHEDLMVAGREIQSRRMGGYTRKMVPRVALDDLVTTDRVLGTLREIVQTIRHRHIVFQDWGFGDKVSTGKGLCALFSGPPGTGKSMAAQCIARELGMNLFRVNLARVVSKYIGETEENLAKVFEEARESHSILLFDEADALFAKRTKVKSAQDRYANLEVNFLLQEVEGFEGMVVLTSNLDSMIDGAFKRRLNYRVHFPLPDTEARAKIWRTHIPDKAPMDGGVDFEALAEDLEVSGGYIKNAVVRAAQWAAEELGVITQEMLARAAEAEMAETGRLVRESR